MNAKRRQRTTPVNTPAGTILLGLSLCCLLPAIASVLLAWPDSDSLAILLPLALAGASAVLLMLPFVLASATKRVAIAVMALATLVVIVPHLLPEFAHRTREAPPRADAAMVILYWKMDRQSTALDQTVDLLRGSKADALLLEETDGALGQMLDDRLKDLYPHRSLCRSACGYAIYSRRPIIAEQRWKANSPPLIWIRTSDRVGKVATLVNAHIPADDVRSTAAAMARELPAAIRGSMVLVGDMNMMPWSHTMLELDLLMHPMTRKTRWLRTWPGQVGGLRFPFAFMPFDQVYVGDQWRSITIARIRNAPSGHYPLLMSLSR